MHSASLSETEALGARGATHPRVTLDSIKDSIAGVTILYGNEIPNPVRIADGSAPIDLLTVCFVTMKNGFVVVGKSAPASPENYDAEKGKIFAYEDAIRQLWPLMGFALRDKLSV